MNHSDKPGSPDFVIKGTKVAIFVHGCFWHRHRCRSGRSTPRTNRAFWLRKFRDNIERDRRKARALRSLGYKVWVIWECETGDQRQPSLAKRLARRLSTTGICVTESYQRLQSLKVTSFTGC